MLHNIFNMRNVALSLLCLCSALAFAQMDLAGGKLEIENEFTFTPLEYYKNNPKTNQTKDYDGLFLVDLITH